MKVQISASSHLQRTPVYQLVDQQTGKPIGVHVWGRWAPIDIPSDPSDAYYPIAEKDVGRLDSIAYAYYRNPYLWWIIAWVNDIQNPLEMEIGQVIRIPAFRSVRAALANTSATAQQLLSIDTLRIPFGIANTFLGLAN